MAQLGGTTIIDVQDREFAGISVRRVQQVEDGKTAPDQFTGTGDVELELASLVTCLRLNDVPGGIIIHEVEDTTRDVDEGLLISRRPADWRQVATDGNVTGTEFEDAIATRVGTDADFRQAQRVVRREPVVDEDITISTRRTPDGEGGRVRTPRKLQGSLEVKGASAAIRLTKRDGVGAEDGICGGDVDHTGTVHTDPD